MEQAYSEKRRARTPLSPEELFYFIELKKLLKQEQRLLFKKTRYYRNLSLINITYVFLISYIVMSAFCLCRWHKAYVLNVDSSYAAAVPGLSQRPFSDVYINTVAGEYLSLKTRGLYELPKKFDEIWVGTDFLFGKTLKARLFRDGSDYFHFNMYPLFFVCAFVMLLVYVIYSFNLHLTRHGLTGITTLLSLAFMYIVFV